MFDAVIIVAFVLITLFIANVIRLLIQDAVNKVMIKVEAKTNALSLHTTP